MNDNLKYRKERARSFYKAGTLTLFRPMYDIHFIETQEDIPVYDGLKAVKESKYIKSKNQ